MNQHALHPGNRVQCNVTRSWGTLVLTPDVVRCSQCASPLTPPPRDTGSPPGTGCVLAVALGVVFWTVAILTWVAWVRG